MSTPATDCWFLTGPTASGKTGIGVELARRVDAEVVSLDSMALYRGMDIGTAKPTPEERADVPHHLIDVIEPHEHYSIARYLEAAHQCIDEILGRGRQVLFVGGTPLYLKGLLRGIFEGPTADWEFRKQLRDEAAEHEPGWLQTRLAEVDPASAARLHANDTKRLVRALEVFEKTGQPISELQKQFEVGRAADECRVFTLNWPRKDLHERINRRVDLMFDAGLVDEVRRLLAGPNAKPLSRTASMAVGYREVIEHLQDKSPLADAIAAVKTHTRQLAKRQCTWFRGLTECRFIPVPGRIDPEECAQRIADLGRLD